MTEKAQGYMTGADMAVMDDATKARLGAAKSADYRAAGLTPDVRAGIKVLRGELRALSVLLGDVVALRGLAPADAAPELRDAMKTLDRLTEDLAELTQSAEKERQ